MTDYKKYINALRKCAKEHENDRTLTGQIIVSDLCEAIADLLEKLSSSEEPNKSEIPTGSNTKNDISNRTIIYKAKESKEIQEDLNKLSELNKPTAKNDLGVREFEGIEVTYPPEDACAYPEYKGKPYFGIKYKENGEEMIGYGTYNPEVLSQYLKDYFISTTKNDLVLIHTWGLDEEIRCIMCTNHMKSDRGCDGSCAVNKDMYNAVMDAIEKRIQSTESEPKDSGNELTNPFGDSRFGG